MQGITGAVDVKCFTSATDSAGAFQRGRRQREANAAKSDVDRCPHDPAAQASRIRLFSLASRGEVASEASRVGGSRASIEAHSARPSPLPLPTRSRAFPTLRIDRVAVPTRQARVGGGEGARVRRH